MSEQAITDAAAEIAKYVNERIHFGSLAPEFFEAILVEFFPPIKEKYRNLGDVIQAGYREAWIAGYKRRKDNYSVHTVDADWQNSNARIHADWSDNQPCGPLADIDKPELDIGGAELDSQTITYGPISKTGSGRPPGPPPRPVRPEMDKPITAHTITRKGRILVVIPDLLKEPDDE